MVIGMSLASIKGSIETIYCIETFLNILLIKYAVFQMEGTQWNIYYDEISNRIGAILD